MSRVTPSDCHTTNAGYMCRFIDLFGMLEARSGSTLRGDQAGGPHVLCAQDGVYLTNIYRGRGTVDSTVSESDCLTYHQSRRYVSRMNSVGLYAHSVARGSLLVARCSFECSPVFSARGYRWMPTSVSLQWVIQFTW